MARNLTNGAGTVDLDQLENTLKGAIQTADDQRAKTLTTLADTRNSLMEQLTRVEKMIVQAGGKVAGTRSRSGRRGRPAGSGSGPRGKRDPLGLQGHIARALIAAKGEMKGTDLVEAVKAGGWPNPSDSFNTQVYQMCRKMTGDKIISNPSRGTYVANAATRKFYENLQAEIKAKAAS